MEVAGTITEIAVVLLLTSIVLVITVCVGKIIIKSNDYGIWLVNGMTMKDIRRVIIMQNTILIMVPALISTICTYFLMSKMFGNILDTGKYVTDVFIKNAIPLIAATAIALIVIVSLVPIMILKRKNASEILKGDLD